jgi:uncharacterized protein YkwD
MMQKILFILSLLLLCSSCGPIIGTMLCEAFGPDSPKYKKQANRKPNYQPRKKNTPFTPTAFEEEVLKLVNQARNHGVRCGGEKMPKVPALVFNEKLRRSARKHAKDMGKKGYFSHESQDGSSPMERIEDQNYEGRAWGENIAAGQSTPREVMDSWLKSEGHCRNIMNKMFKEIGIGAVKVNDSPYRMYWVQNFGTRLR